MNENKQGICNALLETLKLTRRFEDMCSMEYVAESNGDETVIVTYQNGAKQKANVTMDSGFAMIRDIMRQIL